MSKIENGKASPSLLLAHRLVRALETDISWLLEEIELDETPVYRAGELTIDGEMHARQAGDAFCFRSDLPHSYRNVGKEKASSLWVCTPPTF